MTEPLKFTSVDSDTILYACRKCRMVVASSVTFGGGPGSEAQARELAAAHCEPRKCDLCDKVLPETAPRHSLRHDECKRERDAAAELERFTKAAKVPLHDYDGEYVYFDGWSGDGYVAAEYVEDELGEVLGEVTLPRYAYACDPVSLPKFDAHQLVIDLCENGEMHEEAADMVEGLDELQEALDAWHAKQVVTSYMVDFGRVVLLDALVDRLESERAEQGIAQAEEKVNRS